MSPTNGIQHSRGQVGKNPAKAARPGHQKVLRPKDASYSESIIQEFRKEDIPTELATLYDLQEIIGIGTTSKVYKCKRRTKNQCYACKIIDKRKVKMEIESKEFLLEQLRKEIEILQHLHHNNIVAFQEVIETADKIFVVMELVEGGELFEYLLDRGPLPEEVALSIMRQVISAIAYMHEHGVVHRDLKAENLLLVDKGAQHPFVKLIDFGFSTVLRHNLTGSFLGSGGYIAPEIRQQRLYSQSVDIWACGVLLYLLLSCRLPFNADVETLCGTRQQVEGEFQLSFAEPIWRERSESVKHLLRQMLLTDPVRRKTIKEVARDKWVVYGPAADKMKPGLPRPVRRVNPQESSVHAGCVSTAASNGPTSLRSHPLSIPIDGAAMPKVRSSMNLERMLIPVNAISRTPPSRAHPHLPTFMPHNHPEIDFGPSVGNHIHHSSDKNNPNASASSSPTRALRGKTSLLEGTGAGRMAAGQRPVLVSYMPQTIHNHRAGDLSSTSNLSLKFSDQKFGTSTYRR